MAESEEELKSLLMKAKGKSEKAGFQPSIQKTKIMASSPLTSRQIDEKGSGVIFHFLGSKISAGPAAMKLKDAWTLEEKLCQT